MGMAGVSKLFLRRTGWSGAAGGGVGMRYTPALKWLGARAWANSAIFRVAPASRAGRGPLNCYNGTMEPSPTWAAPALRCIARRLPSGPLPETAPRPHGASIRASSLSPSPREQRPWLLFTRGALFMARLGNARCKPQRRGRGRGRDGRAASSSCAAPLTPSARGQHSSPSCRPCTSSRGVQRTTAVRMSWRRGERRAGRQMTRFPMQLHHMQRPGAPWRSRNCPPDASLVFCLKTIYDGVRARE